MGGYLTPEGGFAVQMINNTGAISAKGTLVCPSQSLDRAVRITETDDIDPCGVVYNDGAPQGGDVWVVIAGCADVLLEDNTAAGRGYWARASINQGGRADITNATPPGGTVIALEGHMKEIGHSQETVAAGINKLCRVFLHFN